MVRVRAARRHPRTERTGLVDALLEDLAFLVLAVGHQLVGVLRHIELAHRRIDADLTEQALHAEGARLVGDDGHDVLADLLVLQQRRQHAHEGHGGRDLAALARLQQRLEGVERRDGERRRLATARRQETAQSLAARTQVIEFGAVLGGLAERQPRDLLVRDRDVEAVAEGTQVVVGQLLLLVRDHLALARLAHAETFDGLREDDGRLAAVRARRGVGRIDLARIVAAAVEAPDLLVRHVGDHGLELGVLAEEVLARVRTTLGLEVLVLAVDALLHDAAQLAAVVLGEQRVPTRAPKHLDDIPAGTEECGLELLDDLAVAAHRTVEALQVAVDDEDEVVELLPHRHGERAHRLRLVHLAVAEEGPDLAVRGRHDAAMLKISLEAGLEDRLHRPEAHRHRRELPEIGHQPGVGVGRQAVARDFLPEVAQLVLGEAALEIGARIDAGRGVTLHEHHVARMRVRLGAPEMVETDLVQSGRGRVGRDVAAVLRGDAVGLHDHRHGVPADVGLYAALELTVARIVRLLPRRDAVEIGRVGLERQIGARPAGVVDQLLQKEMRPLGTVGLEHRVYGLQPLAGLAGIEILMLRISHADGACL